MIATEAAAKDNWWCPEARVAPPFYQAATQAFAAGTLVAPMHSVVCNRDVHGAPPGTACLGTGCGKWRWYDDEYEFKTIEFSSNIEHGADADKVVPPKPEPGWEADGEPFKRGHDYYDRHQTGRFCWFQRERRPTPNRRGYCGAAGYPFPRELAPQGG